MRVAVLRKVNDRHRTSSSMGGANKSQAASDAAAQQIQREVESVHQGGQRDAQCLSHGDENPRWPSRSRRAPDRKPRVQ